MILMSIGLLLFISMHSVRIFAEDWRIAQINKRGEKAWLGFYAAVSLVGLIFIIWGYGEARGEVPILWYPPAWMKYLAALFIIPGMILMVAADVSGTKLKEKIGHPMIVGVKLWAFGHLLINGSLADIILFSTLLIWAIFNFRAARKRDKAAAMTYPFAGYERDVRAVIVSVVVTFIFILYLHGFLIGVTPFP